MAGLNTRFHDVGFDVPKYLLPWKDSTIINEILLNFHKNFDFENILLIANQRDIYFKDQLIESIRSLELNKENLYYIGDTKGQADTAVIGAKLFENSKSPLCIHNADTILSGIDFTAIEESLKSHDAFIDIFTANSDKYCYVRTENNLVKEIKEKQVTGVEIIYSDDNEKQYYVHGDLQDPALQLHREHHQVVAASRHEFLYKLRQH